MKKNRKKSINYRSFKICGVKVDFINLKKALSEVEKWVESNKKYQITTPNAEHIVLAQSDYRFKKVINNSDLAICDSVGVLWAGRIKLKIKNEKIANNKLSAVNKQSLIHRLSGVDLMKALCKRAVQKKRRIFLLGGKNGSAELAAEKLKNKIQQPTINYFSGPKNIKQITVEQNKQIIKRINKFKPDFLFVAFGAPMQEKWIADNLKKLDIKVAMGVGGAFDYLAGATSRAPKWLRKIGLEWLWRLIHQPWRWKRQTRLLKFIYLVMRELLISAY